MVATYNFGSVYLIAIKWKENFDAVVVDNVTTACIWVVTRDQARGD